MLPRLSIDARKFEKFLKDLLKRLKPDSIDVLDGTVTEIRDLMREPGRPIRYPVQWDTDKQRVAFFASDGFGAGIPTGRTGDYQAGWKKAMLPNGLSLSAPHPAGAIGGTMKAQAGGFASWQSRIHRGRWRNLRVTVLDALALLPKKILKMLKVISGQ
jgi:hypothetical protein